MTSSTLVETLAKSFTLKARLVFVFVAVLAVFFPGTVAKGFSTALVDALYRACETETDILTFLRAIRNGNIN